MLTAAVRLSRASSASSSFTASSSFAAPLQFRRKHEIDGEQAQEPLGILVLALISELDATLCMPLQKKM